MTHTIDNLDFETISSLVEDKGLILVNKENRDKAIDIIKRWIAVKIANEYNGDPHKMIEESKFILQFKVVLWLRENILIIK